MRQSEMHPSMVVLNDTNTFLINAEPINQYQGLYTLFGVPTLTTFNEITDELITIDEKGFYYNSYEVRHEGENCFIDINNNWVYYYSNDTLVWKPSLIEGEDQLIFGYVANNAILTSSSPFEKTFGIPFAQTIDDDVIELEIFNRESINL